MANPTLDPTWPLGLDVSHYQGTIDWATVARQGFRFAFAKATEGTTWTDPEFAANWAGMQAAGLLRGAYHYYDPGSDPAGQADHFLATVWPNGGQLAPGDLPPVLDIEDMGSQTGVEIVQGIEAWLSRVRQATQCSPILYTNRTFWNELGSAQFGAYPLWIAEYGVATPVLPAGWQQWRLWQYSETGSVAGITGDVDLDAFQGSPEDLARLAAQTA